MARGHTDMPVQRVLKAVEKEADGLLRFAAPDATTREFVVE